MSAKFGALVAIATDDAGEPWAVQSTYIYRNGKRVPKTAIIEGVDKRTNAKPGWVGKAVVRMPGSDQGPGWEPIICEGVETALSIWQAHGGERTVWATLGLSYMGAAPLPPAKRKAGGMKPEVRVAADIFEPGSDAEKVFATQLCKLQRRGYAVFVSKPPPTISN